MQTKHELVSEAIQSAFYKLPNDDQNKLLALCWKLGQKSTKVMPKRHKIELLGRLGIWLFNHSPK